MLGRRRFIGLGLAAAAVAGGGGRAAWGAQKFPGVTDTEIKIGQTMAYSGNSAPYGAYGRAELAYFDMLNAKGGIDGRRIKLLSRDDALNSAKTVELTRQLVEEEEVLLIFSSLGAATNKSVRVYLNQRNVPQLFCASAVGLWGDYEHFPWTMGWAPSYFMEAHVFAAHIRQSRPDGKIAILHENTDLGRDFINGLHDALGDKYAAMVVGDATYDPTDPTVDSQIVSLYGSGADVFINIASAKFAALAIRKAYDIGWRPLLLLTATSTSVSSVIAPAGLDRSTGIVADAFIKDPTDPQWANDPGFREWLAWMEKYNPRASIADQVNVLGYSTAQTLEQVLRQCGDDLSRENVMRQAANLRHLRLPMLLPGMEINTSSDNYHPIRQMHLMRFDGKNWVLFGDLITQ